MSFGKRLAELIEKNKTTAYAVAVKAGLSRQAVGRLISGEHDPTWDTVQKLAAALGVSCEAFASAVELPETGPARKPGRPRNDAESPRKKKGKQS